MNLKHLTDKVLLADTKVLVGKEREISLKVLHHLREIERRRLFSDLGYSSLFDYAIRCLGYSESSASRRIQSARLLQDFPELEKKIEEGSLTMTNVALAALTFKNENITDLNIKKEILSQIENTSKRDCEKKLLEFSVPQPLPREKIKPVTPEFYAVHWNVSQKTLDLIEELKGLSAHKRMTQDQIFTYAMTIEFVKKDKFKIDAKLRSPAAKPCTTKRTIPNSVKNEVFRRDNGRCTRCQGTYKLEYDHIVPYAMGGESTVDNLRILCFSCNQRRLKI